MAQPTIKVIGKAQAAVVLNAKNVNLLKQADKAIKNATYLLEGEVKDSIAGRKAEPASVDTGRLLGSVKSSFPKKMVGAVSTNVEYANFIEYGTSKFPARNHFRNSLARLRKQIIDIIKGKVKQI